MTSERVIKEAPVPVRWAWLFEEEGMLPSWALTLSGDKWWMKLDRKGWRQLSFPRFQVLLSNGQIVIVRAKK